MRFVKQSGFTLIECLMASVLSVLLVTGLFEVYAAIKSSYFLQQSIANRQEQQRFLVSYLSKQIHMATNIKIYSENSAPSKYSIKAKVNSDVLVLTIDNETRAFFIGDSHRKDKQGGKIYSLYQKQVPGQRQELEQGIDDMRIQKGVTMDLLFPDSQHFYFTAWPRVSQ